MKFLKKNLFSICLLFSLFLHASIYGSYYYLTHRKMEVQTDDATKVIDSMDVDIKEIEDLPPPKLMGGDKNPAPVEKKDWVEGKKKDGPDASPDEDIDPNKVSGTGTDKDGYMFSYMGSQPPKPIVGDLDLKKFFPPAAKAANITDKEVVVLVQIDETGKLVGAKVVSGKAGYGFDEAAIKIVNSIRFSPGVNKGKPVKMNHRMPIRFSLDD